MKIIELYLPLFLNIFHNFEIQWEMGEKIRVSKTSAEGLARFWIKIRPITDRGAVISKYYPYIVNSVARGRLIGCQKQQLRSKSHLAK